MRKYFKKTGVGRAAKDKRKREGQEFSIKENEDRWLKKNEKDIERK